MVTTVVVCSVASVVVVASVAATSTKLSPVSSDTVGTGARVGSRVGFLLGFSEGFRLGTTVIPLKSSFASLEIRDGPAPLGSSVPNH